MRPCVGHAFCSHTCSELLATLNAATVGALRSQLLNCSCSGNVQSDMQSKEHKQAPEQQDTDDSAEVCNIL